jgi:biofilm PGA synthesis N-glycosyltransferase PgaC
MDFITTTYFFYMFLSLYFLSFFILLYLRHKYDVNATPKITTEYSISVLIPAHNEEESIQGTVEAILKSNYKWLKEIFIINDGSTDKTRDIAKMLEKRYRIVKLIDKKNSGKADSLNYALKLTKGELIAVVDADSYPEYNAIEKMIGYFDKPSVGAVTAQILVKNRNILLEKMQAMEYKVIAFTRKLLGFVDAIYVTPGPLAVYRRSVLEKIGGFDTNNLTEDIEITWRILSHGFKIEMALPAIVYTVAPSNWKHWYNQRIRWNIGGVQTIMKYKHLFLRKGILGFFILPFFTFSLLLGLIGLSILAYRFIRTFLLHYLATKYSINAQVALLTFEDISLQPSILNFFGIMLFILGFFFTLFCLSMLKERAFKKEQPIIILIYLVMYLTIYPFVMIISLYRILQKKYYW